jgi:hypothetical protein
MALAATDWVSLRKEIRDWFDIPKEGLSSKTNGNAFQRWTGLTQKALEDNWDGRDSEGNITKKKGWLTSCNSFMGKVAVDWGIPAKSCLRLGVLDITKAEQEVPGCWQDASDEGVFPQSGDFYSGWYKGELDGKPFFQKFGHVGIVYDCDREAGTWTLVQGGQGGPKLRVDYIKWTNQKDPPKFDRTKLNGWVDIARYLLPKGPANAPDPVRVAPPISDEIEGNRSRWT